MKFAGFSVRSATIIVVNSVSQIAVLLNFAYKAARADRVYRTRSDKITFAFFYGNKIEKFFDLAAI